MVSYINSIINDNSDINIRWRDIISNVIKSFKYLLTVSNLIICTQVKTYLNNKHKINITKNLHLKENNTRLIFM